MEGAGVCWYKDGGGGGGGGGIPATVRVLGLVGIETIEWPTT